MNNEGKEISSYLFQFLR